jgi:hypothetical protein
MIYSKTTKGSQDIRERIKNLLSTIPDSERLLTYDESKRIGFFNGSQILLASNSNLHAVRGHSFDYVFVDNFSEYTNQSELYTTIVPSTQNIILSSTGTDVGSFFHVLYLSAGIKICQPSIVSEETLKQLKETMSDVHFRREFLCEFVDYTQNKEFLLNLRVTEKEKLEIIENSNRLGFRNVSDYLRFKALDRT